MEKKNKMMILSHVALMGLMCILSCVSAGIIFSGNIPEGYEVVTEASKNASLVIAFSHTANAIALICGMIYMLKGSGKNVAGFYKAFLLLVTVGLALRLAGKLIFPGFDVSAALMIGSLLMLLTLTFVKDLGKTKTMAAFYIMLALDLVVAILGFDSREALSSIASGLTRLLMDGTIGIAIALKYKDKAARGK